jgi:hypothetical protein
MFASILDSAANKFQSLSFTCCSSSGFGLYTPVITHQMLTTSEPPNASLHEDSSPIMMNIGSQNLEA